MELTKSQAKLIKYISLGVAVLFALVITILGGGMILVYLGLAITFFVVGWLSKGVLQVYKEYRIALKVNTVMYNNQETEKMKKEIEQLKGELKSASDRMSLMAATNQKSGGNYFDHIDSNRAAGIRQD